MRIFDRYFAVDWSAANTVVRKSDSIWIAGAVATQKDFRVELPLNPPTRHEALLQLRNIFTRALARGERIIVGFDFAFGYPKGAAQYIGGAARWEAVWQQLAARIEDDELNRSNRFSVAAAFNAHFPDDSMRYWGHPHQHVYPGLTPTKPRPVNDLIPERRTVELQEKGAKSVWQLSGAGCVGSQALLGIAALQKLRTDPQLADAIAVWPFETGFAQDLERPIIFAEIYPSRHSVTYRAGEIRDRAQVVKVASDFAAADQNGSLLTLLGEPMGLSPAARRAVLDEEGWIVGVGSMC